MAAYNLMEYVQEHQVPRTKILLPYNLISFVEQGEKIVYDTNEQITISSNSFAFICSGKYLMSEKLPLNGSYKSMMLYFEDEMLNQFFAKHAAVIQELSKKTPKTKAAFAVFDKDPFITVFLAALKMMSTKQIAFSKKILELKFEELMLHLLETCPDKILGLKYRSQESTADLQIRKAVDQNISSNLSVSELAFLCNQSISTFKRKFQKLYGENPSAYFLKKRMEIACRLLLNENPGEVYFKLGYQNHASFSKSFKQIYGITPSQFKSQKLNV